MRTWMRLIAVVLIALPFTWSSLHASEETTDQKIKKLQDDVSKIRKDLDSLKDEVREGSARGARIAEDIKEINQALRAMANREAVISRQSGYGPLSVPPVPPLPTTGTITVQNNYLAAATVRINGRPFVVGPGQSMPIQGVPTGTFQYSVEVDGFGAVEAMRTDNLPAAGYRITIFPRAPY